MNKLDILKDCIKQYDKIILELEQKLNYWEMKQYTALWHYRDGMRISLFIMENKKRK